MDRARRAGELTRHAAAAGLAGLLATSAALAEPYLAVRSGARCSLCHVNPTGGGKRTEFGAAYGYSALAAETLEAAASGAPATPWTGTINDYFALGADARFNLDAARVPNRDDTLAFGTRSAQLYFDLRVVPGRLSVYLDQRVAPGAALNREAYALFWSRERSFYLKAGRFFLPYGLRLEDDAAFIRQASGMNFTTSDDGVEGGMEMGPLSVALALSNGTAGGAENNRDKQLSVLASVVQAHARLGASLNRNQGVGAERAMHNLFAGLRAGRLGALVEIDAIVDESAISGRQRSRAALLEGNLEILRGHNLKLSAEVYDPNRALPELRRKRYSVVWELVPFQHTQLRAGIRDQRGPPQNDAQNADEFFLQWHLFI